MDTLLNAIAENWIVWFVTIVLVVAAVIDGALLKVPNWLTFPFSDKTAFRLKSTKTAPVSRNLIPACLRLEPHPKLNVIGGHVAQRGQHRNL